jgi:hypothetical protein
MQPVIGSQMSSVHGLLSLQLGAVPDVQSAAWHVSVPLQALPSLHDVPFAAGVFWQLPLVQVSTVHGSLSLQSASTLHSQPGIGVCVQPVAGSHPSLVQALLSLQSSGVPGVHTPAWQISVPLQRSASGQGVPFWKLYC